MTLPVVCAASHYHGVAPKWKWVIGSLLAEVIVPYILMDRSDWLELLRAFVILFVALYIMTIFVFWFESKWRK